MLVDFHVCHGIGSAEGLEEKIQEREQAIAERKKKKEEKKKAPEKIPQDPVLNAINRVMETTGADSRFRNQAEYEVRRWLARYYTIDESVSRACHTISEMNENLKNEQKKSGDDRGDISQKLWNKMWGKIRH